MGKDTTSDAAPLSKLADILVKNKIFPNRVVFYNCVFKMDVSDNKKESKFASKYYSNFLLNEIRLSLSEANTKNIPIIDCEHPDNNDFVLKFYKAAIGDFSETVKLDPLYLFSGQSNANSGNISKYLTGKRSIEEKWMKRFGNQTDRSLIRRYFCEPLSLIIQYLINIDLNKSKKLIDKNDISKGTEKNPWESYIDFFSLKDNVYNKLKLDLSENGLYPEKVLNPDKKSNILNIAYVIYLAIQEQSGVDKEEYIPETKISECKTPVKQRTLTEDYEFYINKVNCYGYKTTDRFNMLKKYARTNVYCANELGAIYYYGDKFYAVNDEFIIEQDFDKAQEFYSLCIDEPLIVNNACWSLGYMVLHNKCPIINAMDIDRYQYAADLFNRCTPDYPPALNSLGLVELYRANDLRKDRKISELNEDEIEQLLNHYEKFISYSYKAAKKGLVNGYNAIAGFLLPKENKEFIPLIKAISVNNIELIPMLEASANMDNVWALDQLANVYYRGDIEGNETTRLIKSKKLLERAYNQGYAWSAYHLAVYFTKKDSDEYWAYIMEAAQKGCNDAIEILSNKSKNR